MAEDIGATLERIAKQSSSVGELTKALEQFEAAKKSAMKAGDTRGLLELAKLEKATQKLILAERKRLELQQEVKKQAKAGQKIDIETLKAIEANSKAIMENQKVLQDAAKTQAEVHAAAKKQAAEIKEAALQNFRENTKLGKAFALAGSAAVKFAGGLTFASLAMKAYSRYTEAAEVRQKILIQGFKGFGTPITAASKDIGLAGRAMLATGESVGSMFGSSLPGEMAKAALSFVDTQKEIVSFDEAIASAESTAYRMGVSIDVVSGAMVDFARITGKDNPKALGQLTEGAIAVSRAIGITVPEAVDFVSTRMDKFGGTAASALIGLNELRVESERINTTFGRTIVRGDDLAKTLQQISTQTTVYAIDQRLVGSILRDNIARIQATGESYDNAMKKAQAFTAGLTTQAPEWMQVLSGQDLAGNMAAAFGDGGEAGANEFQKQFGDSLDAAKPGLSKRVQGILAEIKSGDRNSYEGMRLIQELTQGTSVGIESMNKQLLRLSRSTGGSIETIAKQMGVSRDVADGMVKSAEAMEKQQKEVDALVKLPTNELAKQLGISESLAKVMAGAELTDQERAKNLKDFLKLKNEQKLKAQEEQRLAKEAAAAAIRRTKIEKEITGYTDERAKLVSQMGKGGDDKGLKIQIDSIDEVVKGKQAELSQMVSEAASREKAAAELNVQMGQVGSITQGLKDQFAGYASASGNYFKELFAKMGTFPVLVGAAVGVGLMKMFRVFGRTEDWLSKIHAAILAKGVGGGGDGPDIDIDGKDGKDGKTKDGKPKKTTKSKVPGAKKPGFLGKIGGFFKGKGSKLGGALKSGLGSVKNLAGTTMAGIKAAGGGPMKMLKGVPLVGTVVGAAIAIPQAMKLWEKYKKGETLSPSDKIKMVTTLASMIPGIGTAVLMGDMAAEHTGLYDAIDEALKKPSVDPAKDLKTASTDVPKDLLTPDAQDTALESTTGPTDAQDTAKTASVIPESERGAPVWGGVKAAKTEAFDTSPVQIPQEAQRKSTAGLVMAAAEAASQATYRVPTYGSKLAPMQAAPGRVAGKEMVASATMDQPIGSQPQEPVFTPPTKFRPDQMAETPHASSIVEDRAKGIDAMSKLAHDDAMKSYAALTEVVANTGKLLTLLPEPRPNAPRMATTDLGKLTKPSGTNPAPAATISTVDFSKIMSPAPGPTPFASDMSAPAASAAADPGSSAASGPLPAEFGALQPDGSIMLKVSNFMSAFAQGQVMSRGRIRTSG